MTPRLSVVLVVKEPGALLDVTLASLLGQTAAPELIAIDGASSDGTAGRLRAEPRLARVVSEPDRGVYDAMNKGAALARGEWVAFMSAGDLYARFTTLAEVLERTVPGDRIVYGDFHWAGEDAGVVRADGPESIPYAMPAPFESFLIRADLLRERPLDASLSVAGDHAWLLARAAEGVPIRKLPVVVSSFRGGGISETRRRRGRWESWMAARRAFPGWRVDLAHARRFLLGR